MGPGILTATPIALAYVSGTYTITYAAQTGVTYWREDTGVQVTASVILTIGQSLVIQARPAVGYTLHGYLRQPLVLHVLIQHPRVGEESA